MTTRERTLAVLVIPVLAVGALLFFGYQLLWSPLQSKAVAIARQQSEVDLRRDQIDQIRKRALELDKLKAVSLPADVDLARREYVEMLNKLLRESGFDPANYSILPRAIDAKTVPLQLDKKPIYSRMLFAIQAKGELLSLVEFLEKFYRVKLLHQVHNFAVQRPLTTTDRGRANDLDITMIVEALVLDDADKRKTLLPEKPAELKADATPVEKREAAARARIYQASEDAPPVLATGERKYGAIAGRDVFFGPPPVVVVAREAVKSKSSLDFAQFIKFDGYTVGDAGPIITLYDAYTNQEKLIRKRSAGWRVETTYILNGKKRTLRSEETLDVLDADGDIQHRWLLLGASEREVYLQDEDAYYALHIGQRLSEMHKLTTEEAHGLGLIVAKPAEPPEEK